MSLFPIPPVVQRSRFDLFCGLTIRAGELLISKEFSEPGSSIESSIDRRRRVCEDSASLFPQIIGGLGQMCVRLTVADKKTRCGSHELMIMGRDDIDVMEAGI